MKKSLTRIAIATVCALLLAMFAKGDELKPPAEKADPFKIEPKPIAKPPKTVDKKFYFVVGVLAASMTADGISTKRDQDRGCREMNPMLGPHPSVARASAVAVGAYAAEVGVAYLLKKKLRDHKWLRDIWAVQPIYQSTEHARLAYGNEQLKCR